MLRGAPLSICGLAIVVAACSEPLDGESLEVTDKTDAPTDPTLGDDDDATTPAPSNEAPIADAGDDLTALVADEVKLDGSGSYDPDGDVLSFDWTLVDKPIGSGATLINESRSNPSFYADREGVYVVELAVEDGLYVSTDEVSVYVAAPNEGPVANAGPDQTVDVGDRVVLNGSSSYDPDSDPLLFSWTLVSMPGGSAAALDNPASSLPQFTADVAGLYVFDLVVSDGTDSSLADQVRITAQDGGDSDCLSCVNAESELRRRLEAGDLASAGLVGLLPILTLLWQRRRSARAR